MILLSNIKLRIFFKEYIGQPILNPCISYPDMKTKIPCGKN